MNYIHIGEIKNTVAMLWDTPRILNLENAEVAKRFHRLMLTDILIVELIKADTVRNSIEPIKSRSCVGMLQNYGATWASPLLRTLHMTGRVRIAWSYCACERVSCIYRSMH